MILVNENGFGESKYQPIELFHAYNQTEINTDMRELR